MTDVSLLHPQIESVSRELSLHSKQKLCLFRFCRSNWCHCSDSPVSGFRCHSWCDCVHLEKKTKSHIANVGHLYPAAGLDVPMLL